MGKDKRKGTYAYKKVRQDEEEIAAQKAQKKKDDEKKKKEEKKKTEKTVTFQTEIPPDDGISLFVLICFILSDTLGLSILLSPGILKHIGWFGLPLTVLIFPVLLYTGYLLCKACEYASVDKDSSEELRDPYPYTVEASIGKPGRIIFILVFALFQIFVCVISLAAISNIMYDMLPSILPGVSAENNLRVWVSIWGVTLYLFLLPGSPKSSWVLGVVVSALSILAVILLISLLGMLLSYENFMIEMQKLRVQREESMKSPNPFEIALQISACIGGMIWGFGAHVIYPTLQADSKNQEDLPKAISISYIILMLVTVVTCCMAYAAFGDTLEENLLNNLTKAHLSNFSGGYMGALVTLKILICIHIATVYTLNINPINLWLENALEIPTEFCWQRAVNRGIINILIMAAAVGMPSFVPAVKLSGGLLTTLLCVVFPAICYVKLEDDMRWYNYILIGIAVSVILVIAVLSSYANVLSIVTYFTSLSI